MNRKLFISYFILLGHICFGQDNKLEGEILDRSNKSPLIFANIILEGTAYGAASDRDGRFSILNIEAGTYTIIATYMGYSSFKQEITIPYTEQDKIFIDIQITYLIS